MRTLTQIMKDQLSLTYPMAITIALAVTINCPWYDQVCELEQSVKPSWAGR